MNNSLYIGSVSERFSFFDRYFTIDSDQGQALYRMDITGQGAYCMPKEASFKVSDSKMTLFFVSIITSTVFTDSKHGQVSTNCHNYKTLEYRYFKLHN
jgi:hypothetical protein